MEQGRRRGGAGAGRENETGPRRESETYRMLRCLPASGPTPQLCPWSAYSPTRPAQAFWAGPQVLCPDSTTLCGPPPSVSVALHCPSQTLPAERMRAPRDSAGPAPSPPVGQGSCIPGYRSRAGMGCTNSERKCRTLFISGLGGVAWRRVGAGRGGAGLSTGLGVIQRPC